MPDDETPADQPLYITAAEALGIGRVQPAPTLGLSQSPGLREVDNSPVPNAGRSHVFGPGQAACDPVLAGLDMNHDPMTRAENRAITRMDGATVVPPPDSASSALPGPTGTSAPAAPQAAEAALPVTPTAMTASAVAQAAEPETAPEA